MAYLIKTYTFSTPVPETSHHPFAGQANISFSDAQEEIIYLDDRDNKFVPVDVNTGRDQKLLKETEIGGVTLPEGTMLTYRSNLVTMIIDPQTGYRYLVMFPQQAGTAVSNMTEIGDRTTVMVIPETPDTPEFDPSRTYNYHTAPQKLEIVVKPAAIPPNYLSGMCFAAGSLIETANGSRPVETLRLGDLILTRDHGLRPLSWIGGRKVSARLLDVAPNLRPVTIRKGALGPGLPAQDLVLSPQHRVLMTSTIAERIAGTSETLIAVKHLCGMPGIAASPTPKGIDYHHLLFDRHELVLSNGCWTESLFTGPQAMRSMGPSARREIALLFPQLLAGTGFAPARPFLSGRDGRELARRHLKNAKPLLV